MSTEGAFQAWSTDRRYRYGRRVKWRGVKLECRHDHYCGHAASDPFDPFWGWSTEAARKTWQLVSGCRMPSWA